MASFPRFLRKALSALLMRTTKMFSLFTPAKMSEAPFYILDEPFTQVDPVNVDEVKALIRERSRDHGIIATDHNYDALSSVADNLFVIADGYTNPVRCREDLVRHGYLR